MRVWLVLSTAPDKKSARKIADSLLRQKLAACVSFGSRWTSVYCWKGKKTAAAEILLLVKTSSAKVKAAEKAIREIHPYELPEIVAWQAGSVSAAYASWVSGELK